MSSRASWVLHGRRCHFCDQFRSAITGRIFAARSHRPSFPRAHLTPHRLIHLETVDVHIGQAIALIDGHCNEIDAVVVEYSCSRKRPLFYKLHGMPAVPSIPSSRPLRAAYLFFFVCQTVMHKLETRGGVFRSLAYRRDQRVA